MILCDLIPLPAFVDNTMLLISVWTVACSSLDKFYMVQYPLHYHRNITWARVTKLIGKVVCCSENIDGWILYSNLFSYFMAIGRS